MAEIHSFIMQVPYVVATHQTCFRLPILKIKTPPTSTVLRNFAKHLVMGMWQFVLGRGTGARYIETQNSPHRPLASESVAISPAGGKRLGRRSFLDTIGRSAIVPAVSILCSQVAVKWRSP